MANARVLDTSVASLLLNRSKALDAYLPLLKGASLALSFQSVAEMRFGAMRAKWGPDRREQLERFLHRFAIVGYSDRLCSCWAEIMCDAARAGRRLEAGDGWIAATARYLDAPLLTHDKDFDAAACPSITIHRFAG